MSDQRVVVHGADELNRAMAKLDDAAQRAADDAATKAAEKLAASARATTPRLTGRLASAVVVQHPSDGGAEVAYGLGVPYAGWIEYGGTRGRPYVAQGRYLGAGVDAAAREYVDTTDRNMDTELRKLPWPK